MVQKPRGEQGKEKEERDREEKKNDRGNHPSLWSRVLCLFHSILCASSKCFQVLSECIYAEVGEGFCYLNVVPATDTDGKQVSQGQTD